MEKLKKYLPFFIVMVFLILFLPSKETINKEWLGIVILFIGIILLFEFIENSRLKRMKKWSSQPPSKLAHVIKFSLFFGLPISLTISFLIYSKAEITYLILFIVIPLTIIFGWIGFLDWQSCDRKFLEEKYNVDL